MFFSLFNKKHKFSSLGLSGLTDVHSHILPGVDDGASTEAESFQLLEYLESIGYGSVILTPHTMEEIPNTPEKLRTRFEEFKKSYKGNLKLQLASEYMIDAAFAKKIECGEYLNIGVQHQILVETSYVYAPENFETVLDSILASGVYPVIAHPERYRYMDDKQFQRIKQKGCRFQLNLNSLSGYYGEVSMKRAHEILKNGDYTYVGTDLHTLKTPFDKFVDKIRLTTKEADALTALYENNARI